MFTVTTMLDENIVLDSCDIDGIEGYSSDKGR